MDPFPQVFSVFILKSLQELKNLIKIGQTYEIKYIDDEGGKIEISQEIDYKEAIIFLHCSSLSSLICYFINHEEQKENSSLKIQILKQNDYFMQREKRIFSEIEKQLLIKMFYIIKKHFLLKSMKKFKQNLIKNPNRNHIKNKFQNLHLKNLYLCESRLQEKQVQKKLLSNSKQLSSIQNIIN